LDLILCIFHINNTKILFYIDSKKWKLRRDNVKIVLHSQRRVRDAISPHRVIRVDECTQQASMHARVHAFAQRHAVCLLRPVNYSNRYRLYLCLYAPVVLRGTGEWKVDGEQKDACGMHPRRAHAVAAQRAILRCRKIRSDRKQSQLNRIRLINFIRAGKYGAV